MSEVSQATFYDAINYFWNGRGSEETHEPTCEVRLIDTYPHKSVGELRLQIESPDRIQTVDKGAQKTSWIVDKVLSVTGLNADLITANQAIWSKRRWVSITGAVLGGITSLASVAAGVVGSKAVGVTFGVASSQLIVGGAIVAGVIGLITLVAGCRRAMHASVELDKSRLTACLEIAQKRQKLLEGDLESALEAKGASGMTLSKNHIIAPQECEWLWIQSVRSYAHAHSPRFMDSEAKEKLMLEFARTCPLSHTNRALMTASEAKREQVLLKYLEPVLPAAQSLSSQLESITETYDRYDGAILSNAAKNIKIVNKNRSSSLAFIDSIYIQQSDSAKRIRDNALAPLRPNLRGLTLEQRRAAERNFENRADVRQIRKTYSDSINSYKNIRSLARIAAEAWFDRQIKLEKEKKDRDLAANKAARLAYLQLFTPAIQSVLNWTVKAIDHYETDRENKSIYPNYLLNLGPAPEMPYIAPPQAPNLRTAEAPAQPSESDMSSWWPSAGQGLTLLAAAGGIAALWSQFRREQEQQQAEPAPTRAEGTDDLPPPPTYDEAMRNRR